MMIQDESKKTPFEVEFDIPYKDLVFSGRASLSGHTGKGEVSFMPTKDCLVDLSDSPFFIMDIAEVEVVYFERVTHNLKYFDIVFICKDYETWVRVGLGSHCRFAPPLIHFIPHSLTYSVPLFLKRQCDRTLGPHRLDPDQEAGDREDLGGLGQRPVLRGRARAEVEGRAEGGAVRAIHDCHFAVQLTHFILGFL
jgi:hypothetical protein